MYCNLQHFKQKLKFDAKNEKKKFISKKKYDKIYFQYGAYSTSYRI